MAKATSKTKKEQEKSTEVQLPVPPKEETVVPEIKETVNEIPPVVIEQPTVVAAEPVVVEEKTVELPPIPVLKRELDKSLPMEERVIAFLEGKVGFIQLNDFLKSLYPIQKFNEQPVWSQQGVNKQLRNMFVNMQTSGQLTVRDNKHIMLGTAYYPDSTTLKTHYHNLNSVVIEAMGAKK